MYEECCVFEEVFTFHSNGKNYLQFYPFLDIFFSLKISPPCNMRVIFSVSSKNDQVSYFPSENEQGNYFPQGK
jgi:hypothetical protein